MMKDGRDAMMVITCKASLVTTAMVCIVWKNSDAVK